MNKNPVLLSDLSLCEPKGGLSRVRDKDHLHFQEWSMYGQLDQLEAEAPTLYRRYELKTLMGYATRYSFNNFG